MLGQAFTVDNFLNIFDEENRKGIYLEKRFWPELVEKNYALRDIAKEFRGLKKSRKKKDITKKEHDEKKELLNEQKDILLKEKEDFLRDEFQKISETVLEGRFAVDLQCISIAGKSIYNFNKNCPISFFTFKQIQHNLKTLYKIKQQNRDEIICQLKSLLVDTMPKWLIKTDIKNFYESIDQELLRKKITSDSLLSLTSQKIIIDALLNYKRQYAKNTGIPRGLSISAYLAELYMRDFDKYIIEKPEVFFYARYVDDIVILTTPIENKKPEDLLDDIDKRLNKYGLSQNPAKSQAISLPSPKNIMVEYLGYSFTITTDKNKRLEITISNKRLNRYKKKISIAFSQFEREKIRRLKIAAINLYNRLRFLTSNTRLVNNKKNAIVGIYFSNRFVNNDRFLGELDRYLHSHAGNLHSEKLKLKILNLSFRKGFTEKLFSKFTHQNFSTITRVWKNVI